MLGDCRGNDVREYGCEFGDDVCLYGRLWGNFYLSYLGVPCSPSTHTLDPVSQYRALAICDIFAVYPSSGNW